ncbi:MAG TPA: hypothetical protein VFZ66_06980, partial [Herpetosiphonaceae bacterium]
TVTMSTLTLIDVHLAARCCRALLRISKGTRGNPERIESPAANFSQPAGCAAIRGYSALVQLLTPDIRRPAQQATIVPAQASARRA